MIWPAIEMGMSWLGCEPSHGLCSFAPLRLAFGSGLARLGHTEFIGSAQK